MPISLLPLGQAAVEKVGGGILGVVTGLFKSKKHYHLYFWDAGQSAWIFVLDGHPSQVNPLATQYRMTGVPVAVVRNKDDKAPDGTLAPKTPPAGYGASSSGLGSLPGGLNPWILAGIAGAAVLGFVLLRRKRRS